MAQPETESGATLDQWILELDDVARRLRAAQASAPGADAEASDQIVAETAIAHVLALIAGPKLPTPIDLAGAAGSRRPIASSDLLITVDLVRKNAKSAAITSSDLVDAPDFGC